MLFKVDENLPAEIADLLRTAGHLSDTVAEEGLAGTQDPVLATILMLEQRVLVTLDKGFADIRTYSLADYPGIVVLRPKRQDKKSLVRLGQIFIQYLETEPISGSLWIVEEDRIRIR